MRRTLIVKNLIILSMQALEHNIQSLKLRINEACNSANRDENSVYLLPVSKTRPSEELQQALALGFDQFAENYLSEAKKKLPKLPPSITWHFIGPLQSNKTRYIAEHFDWLQTLDRSKLVKRLNDQRPKELEPLNVLIQVNISEDPNKSGVKPEEVNALAKEIEQAPNLKLRGLMTIPQAYSKEEKAKTEQDFAKMHNIFQELKQRHTNCDTLSMGMSGDLELAIKHGSTMIRIGTDFFGPRQAAS